MGFGREDVMIVRGERAEGGGRAGIEEEGHCVAVVGGGGGMAEFCS